MARLNRIILWTIKPIRLFLVKLSYNVGWLNSISRPSAEPRPAEKPKGPPAPLRDLAQKLDLLNEYSPAMNLATNRKSACWNPKSAKEGDFFLFDELAETYIRENVAYSMNADDSTRMCYQWGIERKHMAALKENPVFKLFVESVQHYKEAHAQGPYVDFLVRKIKRWKELVSQGGQAKLLCRICEQMVVMDKFMRHTELCVRRTEHKKEFQNVDEALLNVGEELTETIKNLSRKLPSKKETATALIYGSPCKTGLRSRVPNRRGGILQKYSNNMPAVLRARDGHDGSKKGVVASVKQSLFASLKPVPTISVQVPTPPETKAETVEPERPPRPPVDPDAFTVNAKLKASARKSSTNLSQPQKVSASPRGSFLGLGLKDGRLLGGLNPPQAKDRFLRSRQALAKFAPSISQEDPSKAEAQLKAFEDRVKVYEALKGGSSGSMTPLLMSAGKLPLLKQRSKIRNLLDQLQGKGPAPARPMLGTAQAGKSMTVRNLFEGMIHTPVPEQKQAQTDDIPLDPLNKAMKRFMKTSSISPVCKASVEDHKAASPFDGLSLSLCPEPWEQKSITPSARVTRAAAEAKSKRKIPPAPRLPINEIKEVDEEEPAAKLAMLRPMMMRNTKSDSTVNSCSLLKHRAMRKFGKLHGIQSQTERLQKIMSETTTLLSNREEIEVLDRLRCISRNAYLTDIAFNSVGIIQLTKLIDVLDDVCKQYRNTKSIAVLVQKLIVNIQNKIRVIKDYAVLGYEIDNINRKVPIGVHPLTLLEDYVKRKELSEMPLLKTPKTVYSRNMRGLNRCGTIAPRNRDGILLPQQLDTTVSRMPVPRNSDVDLRRLAIENSIKGIRQLGEERIKTPMRSSSGSLETEQSLVSDATNGSFVCDTVQLQGDEAGKPMSSEDLPIVSVSVSFSRRHDSQRNIASSHLSKSVVLPHRKPFDKTEGEQQIEAIYKDAKRHPMRRASFEEELMMEHQFEEDQRRSNSCALDYSLATCYYKARKVKRSNSFVTAERAVSYGEESSLKPKKYVRIVRSACRVTIEDFDIIHGLSSGAYGRVCLVKKKSSGDYFALKMIDREKTIAKSQEDYIMSEINILRNLDSDYIVKLYYSFQSDDYLYFVMDYMNGGDFGNLLQNIGTIEEKYAKLYVSEIVLALEYLHSKNIYHRDMKPENMLIDARGHLKLTDFGLSQSRIEGQHRKWIQNYFKAKEQPSRSPAAAEDRKTPTNKQNSGSIAPRKKKRFVGTPHYLAPEIITGQNGSFAADWWAVGVILFEMLMGAPPFNGNTPEEIFENILHNKRDLDLNVGYNDDQISPDAAALINGLLTPEPEKRLGCNGAKEVRAQAFFQGVNWDGLRNEEPPFVPSPLNVTDTTYFSEKKQFEVRDIEAATKHRKATPKDQHSVLGFDFDTTNVGSLAQKNKDAFRGASSDALKMCSRPSLFNAAEYDPDDTL